MKKEREIIDRNELLEVLSEALDRVEIDVFGVTEHHAKRVAWFPAVFADIYMKPICFPMNLFVLFAVQKRRRFRECCRVSYFPAAKVTSSHDRLNRYKIIAEGGL